ncbi:hypothetical protein BC835DRAFT_1413675 [Cytidiella melzeri]|nr:hypothetical protein BC835DRAFT_1413675 [Cytidiella melzeri]
MARTCILLIPQKSALQLCFEADGCLLLHRLGPVVGSLRNKVPKLIISAKDVHRADIATTFSGVTRFNGLLALTIVTHPFARKGKLELHHHVKREGGGYNDEGFFLREADPPVDIVNDEARVEQGSTEDGKDYAIVLHNFTPKKLYVQVRYFDPNTYSMTTCYKSAEPVKATLAANGGGLQTGASSERADPLQYYVPDDATSHTMFVKVRPTNLDSCDKIT